MSVLSDGEIKEAFNEGSIQVEPEPDWEEQLQPASLDLRIGSTFQIYRLAMPVERRAIDLREGFAGDFMSTIELEEGEKFMLAPKMFALASTIETVGVPLGMVARVDGRSSYGRLGLMVHSTAGFIDPGFKGEITLELMNVGAYPIILHPGTRVCQVSFQRLGKSSVNGYQGKYQGQKGATASKAHLDEQQRPEDR